MERLFDLFDIINKHSLPIALAHKKQGTWKTYSTNDYIKTTNTVSSGLLSLGVKKGDRIASITNDRPEWNFIDLGIQQIGAIHVPINFTALDEEIKFILNETESIVVFVSTRFIYTRLSKLLIEIPQLIKIFTFTNVKGADNFEVCRRLSGYYKEKNNLKKSGYYRSLANKATKNNNPKY